ncbi:subtilisin family serine protease [Geodermatophilus bullaregiensis]|uniref:S8 family serine peptidase n=1 Tax=Geodermatophilus bullaregiensis TaxID=1564160 RepID=UPI001957B231|nr:S8 family serine peptidase [Geodermatophilus bullaregiensis]MBM7809043.1 subtilisin family serine protease [Geodermatophilus bullaregiensis]
MTSPGSPSGPTLSTPVDDLLAAALDSGGDSLETGRFIATFREDAVDAGIQSLSSSGMRVADARDFDRQAVSLGDVGDAEVLVFPEIGAAVLSGPAATERGMTAETAVASDSPVEAIEPEYFVFAEQQTLESLRTHLTDGDTDGVSEYLRGFVQAAEVIARDLGNGRRHQVEVGEEETLVLGATWGLVACRVPQSTRSGAGVKVAVLDTGLDLGHPDFTGRHVVHQTFVGQPVQDLHSHGTHCIGTACGPKAPAGSTPRYGIGHRTSVFAGKVLSNTGSGSTAGVLAGMNWAIANRCEVISMSLGSQAPVQAAYTAAGRAALNNGSLIVAAAGNASAATGAPANSPTIMSVASLDRTLAPSAFSNFGKVEIAAPGRDVLSSVPRPTRYGTKSGTSMATPHVAGCAALWAQPSPSLRGESLWRRLVATARHLPHPAARVGAGLVQAP